MSDTTPAKARGLNRLRMACLYSANGLRVCFRSEEAFRQEAIAALVLIPLGLWLGDGAAEKALLVAALFLVLIVELLNTAIEKTVDRISSERHPLSGQAKDIASAAVSLSLLLCALIWGLVIIF